MGGAWEAWEAQGARGAREAREARGRRGTQRPGTSAVASTRLWKVEPRAGWGATSGRAGGVDDRLPGGTRLLSPFPGAWEAWEAWEAHGARMRRAGGAHEARGRHGRRAEGAGLSAQARRRWRRLDFGKSSYGPGGARPPGAQAVWTTRCREVPASSHRFPAHGRHGRRMRHAGGTREARGRRAGGGGRHAGGAGLSAQARRRWRRLDFGKSSYGPGEGKADFRTFCSWRIFSSSASRLR